MTALNDIGGSVTTDLQEINSKPIIQEADDTGGGEMTKNPQQPPPMQPNMFSMPPPDRNIANNLPPNVQVQSIKTMHTISSMPASAAPFNMPHSGGPTSMPQMSPQNQMRPPPSQMRGPPPLAETLPTVKGPMQPPMPQKPPKLSISTSPALKPPTYCNQNTIKMCILVTSIIAACIITFALSKRLNTESLTSKAIMIAIISSGLYFAAIWALSKTLWFSS